MTSTLLETPPRKSSPTPYGRFDQLFLNGHWRHGRSGKVADDRDPFTNEVLVQIPLADERDLDEAFRASAREQPLWQATLPGERAEILRSAAEERGERIALRMQAGMTHVNDSSVNDLPNCPFGGEKNRGIGRYNGQWAIDEFTTAHWISVQHAPLQYPF